MRSRLTRIAPKGRSPEVHHALALWQRDADRFIEGVCVRQALTLANDTLSKKTK